MTGRPTPSLAPIGRFAVAAAHPALPGHFPGRPVVPGVVLLDEALSLVAAAHPGLHVGGVARVRFLAPVGPDSAVVVLAAAPAGGTLGFSCRVGAAEVLSGTLRVASA